MSISAYDVGNETPVKLSKSALKRQLAREHNEHFEVVAGLERHFDVVAKADPRQAINLAQSLVNNPLAGSRFRGKNLRALAVELHAGLQVQEAREAKAKEQEPATPVEQLDEPGAVDYVAEEQVEAEVAK